MFLQQYIKSGSCEFQQSYTQRIFSNFSFLVFSHFDSQTDVSKFFPLYRIVVDSFLKPWLKWIHFKLYWNHIDMRSFVSIELFLSKPSFDALFSFILPFSYIILQICFQTLFCCIKHFKFTLVNKKEL